MNKLVLAMTAVVIVACGKDKKDPYSPFDNDHWLSSEGCPALGESVVADLWSEIAELDESERDKQVKPPHVWQARIAGDGKALR